MLLLRTGGQRVYQAQLRNYETAFLYHVSNKSQSKAKKTNHSPPVKSEKFICVKVIFTHASKQHRIHCCKKITAKQTKAKPKNELQPETNSFCQKYTRKTDQYPNKNVLTKHVTGFTSPSKIKRRKGQKGYSCCSIINIHMQSNDAIPTKNL